MKLKILLFLYFVNLSVSFSNQQDFKSDSLKVVELNKYAEKVRQIDPKKTVYTANQALRLAEKINFELGQAEAYRVMGTGYSILVEDDTAISKFLLALNLFKKHKDLYGEAMVYNNIGNRYKNYDRKKALSYYLKCISIAKKIKNEELVAGCSINVANIYTKSKKYDAALSYFNKSFEYFQAKNDTVSISIILLSKGFLYAKTKRYDIAVEVLEKCEKICRENRYYPRLSTVYMYLADIYMDQKKYDKAEDFIQKGLVISERVGEDKLKQDFTKQWYYLAKSKGDAVEALKYLENVYKEDSIAIRDLVSKKYTLSQEQFDFIEKQKQTEILLEKQKTNRIKLIAAVIVLALSFVVIALLVIQSRKKAKTLHKMRELNEEISVQKENLDKINQNLENIIEERTEDIKAKNLKLSQYSSHLSHEIRSPVSTIKGLLLLDDEDLIDDQELISEVKRCINDIDNKLLNINHMLHNPQYKAFVLPENADGAIPPAYDDSKEDI